MYDKVRMFVVYACRGWLVFFGYVFLVPDPQSCGLQCRCHPPRSPHHPRGYRWHHRCDRFLILIYTVQKTFRLCFSWTISARAATQSSWPWSRPTFTRRSSCTSPSFWQLAIRWAFLPVNPYVVSTSRWVIQPVTKAVREIVRGKKCK